jgi:curved DNA-binding protein CbpA
MPRDSDDLYAILGLTPDASQAQIDHAYRHLVRTHHPDIHPDSDSAALVAAAAAYAILRNPARRAVYDRSRRSVRDQHPAPVPRRHRAVPDIRAGPVRWHPT